MIKIRSFSGNFWKFPRKMMFGSFGVLKWKNYFFTQISSCHQNFINRSVSKQYYDFSYLEWSDMKIEDFEFHVDLHPTWSRFPSDNPTTDIIYILPQFCIIIIIIMLDVCCCCSFRDWRDSNALYWSCWFCCIMLYMSKLVRVGFPDGAGLKGGRSQPCRPLMSVRREWPRKPLVWCVWEPSWNVLLW